MADTVLHSRSGKEKKDNTSNSGVVSLIDAKIIEEHHIGGSKPCPRCGHKLTSKEDWPGLPAGVKFDPTDQELLEHLEAKVGLNGRKAHPLIDEFIPTLEGEEGICYTHPEKLPGVTKDGHSRHFFHRPSKAYTTGTRKRRKIQSECDLQGGETRWHKTGKTRPVLLNGKQKGCKKILVLYTNFGKQRKPEKTNWVMHQYHLGSQEDEKEGELVVSKVFYQTQPRQCSWERFPIATVDQALQHASSSSRLTIERADTRATATTIATTTTPSALHPLSGNSDRERFSSFSGLCQRSLDEGISESSSRCTPHSCEDGQQQDDDEQSQRSLVRTFPKCLEGNIAGKAAARATSLEDIFEIKEAGTSTFVNAQEVEWMNYSTHYWPNP